MSPFTNATILLPNLSNTSSGCAIASISAKPGGHRSPVSVMDDLKIMVVNGLLLWGTADFTIYGLQNVNNLTATVVDTILETARGGTTGAVIAVTLAKVSD